MGFFSKIFTWWNGPTIGTSLDSWRKGVQVGKDSAGNRYFESRDGARRWILYSGSNDASNIPAEWHGWLHRSTDLIPEKSGEPMRKFEKSPQPNHTGTASAYRPQGALEEGGVRAAATGDYEAWRPAD